MEPLLSRLSFADLPGWDRCDLVAAMETFRRSCREMLEQGSGFTRPVRFGGSPSSWRATCLAAFADQSAREFLQKWFIPYRVHDPDRPEGLFTGYYEPEVAGSRSRSQTYHVPVYRRPPDLVSLGDGSGSDTTPRYGRIVNGVGRPYYTRREIEEGALAGKGLEIVWLRDWADAFFIQVQGSGRVRLAEGGTVRLSYAAKSGLPYTGIGSVLASRGDLSHAELSMQAIRSWIGAHPREGRELMWENQSFVFFREVDLEDPELGALGAQHVQLTPRRSLAVDRSVWMFGTPVWLETTVPGGGDGSAAFRQLLVAQDTGSAIKGIARGDIYWGFGEDAARLAGPMKSPGTMTVLLPHDVSDELGLLP